MIRFCHLSLISLGAVIWDALEKPLGRIKLQTHFSAFARTEFPTSQYVIEGRSSERCIFEYQ